MASHQAKKQDTDQHKQGHAEEPKVLAIAQHFESLADKAKESEMAVGEGGHGVKGKDSSSATDALKETSRRHSETDSNIPTKGEQKERDTNMGGRKEESHGETTHGDKEGKKGGEEGKGSLSLEEIGKYRQQAQQNSMEAIRGAEERYSDANKSSGGGSLQNVKESVVQGVGKLTSYAAEKGAEAKDTAIQGTRKAAEYASEKTGVGKDTNVGTDQQGGESQTNERNQQGGLTTSAKDTIVSAGKTALDYTFQTAEKAKEFTTQKAVPTVVQAGKSAASSGVEISKSAAGYAGQKAVQAKDAAVETGWRVAHYSLDKTAEPAEATANAEQRAAELSAEKAEAAKGEAAMKEQEAQKSCQHIKESVKSEKVGDVSSGFGEKLSMKSSPEDIKKPGPGEQAAQNKGEQGGIFGAVTETLAEIAASAKDIVIGQEPPRKD